MNKYFPEVLRTDSSFIGTKERYIYQYPLVMKYLKKKISGWNFWNFFDEFGEMTICVYANTEFTEMIMDDYRLYSGKTIVKYMSDRNYELYSDKYSDLKTLSPQEMIDLYKAGGIDYIIICSIFRLNDIYLELIDSGIKQDSLLCLSSIISGD